MNSKTNCPNCGAPIEPYQIKCKYCGTIYFDSTIFDTENKTPCYIKFKTSQGTITTLAYPELRTIELYDDSVDIFGRHGNKITSFRINKNCDFNVTFHSLASKNNYDVPYLFTYERKINESI